MTPATLNGAVLSDETELFGVKPTVGEFEGPFYYEGLAFPLPFSGRLLACRGFIDDLYVHMGFHPAWKYKKVMELAFDDGRLIEHRDRSDAVAELRRRIQAGEEPDRNGGAEIHDWMNNIFKRNILDGDRQ